jgi:hypothetical protein
MRWTTFTVIARYRFGGRRATLLKAIWSSDDGLTDATSNAGAVCRAASPAGRTQRARTARRLIGRSPRTARFSRSRGGGPAEAVPYEVALPRLPRLPSQPRARAAMLTPSVTTKIGTAGASVHGAPRPSRSAPHLKTPFKPRHLDRFGCDLRISAGRPFSIWV